MARYRLSRFADADLIEIGSYTLQTWGEEQAGRYFNDLVDWFEKLADNPKPGRACDHIKAGFRAWSAGAPATRSTSRFPKDEAIRLFAQVKPTNDLPKPGATGAKKKKAAKKAAKKKA